ncbi:MAG: chromosomal replication initiator protein DnaA [Candidatus Margulisbacteria bacterium]|nr:chromosomal replication initiator protein DnaA [Candidatus Margulisiibacteriota bacterium]
MPEELDINRVWGKLLSSVEKSLNKPIFETLISSTKPVTLKEGKLEVAVPHEVIKEWLSKHCITLLEEEISSMGEGISKLEFAVGPRDLFDTPQLETPVQDGSGPQETSKTFQDNLSRNIQLTLLNPRYTFDSFVIGHGNRFAHAAALAVAEAPGAAYNPLFLYGGGGLGKTHLMQAIGHSVLKTRPTSKVLYISSEVFTNELINSIRDDKTKEFREKYRNIDVLMVDDIQFLAGKERTQEEFFHTFNALHESNKQIVLTSDRPPKDIPTLEERLRSRFEWGLIADIQPPDFETRIAILRKKAETVELSVPTEVLTFIASKVASNIRELEGALIRVVAFASLSGSDITISLVENVLKDLVNSSRGASITIDDIKRITAEYYSVKIDDMSAKIRTKEIATARQVAMYFAREMTEFSLPKIGEEFGGRDHTTVMHACDKVKTSLKSNSSIDEAVKNIRKKIAELKK